MIIGITGTLGAGKGTVVSRLKEKGFLHFSSSGLLTEILQERGEEVDRDAMARTGRELRKGNPAGVPKENYTRANLSEGANAVFESLHSVEEAEFIKSVGGFVLGIDAPIEVRYERITKRGSVKDRVSYEKFKEQTDREEREETVHTGHSIRGAMKLADYVIENSNSLEDLHAQVDKALEVFSKQK